MSYAAHALFHIQPGPWKRAKQNNLIGVMNNAEQQNQQFAESFPGHEVARSIQRHASAGIPQVNTWQY